MAGNGGHLATVGGRLKASRLRRSADIGRTITQAEAGRVAGVTQPAYNAWENDFTTPPLDAVARLAVLFAVTAGWLAFGEGLASPEELAAALALYEATRPRTGMSGG